MNLHSKDLNAKRLLLIYEIISLGILRARGSSKRVFFNAGIRMTGAFAECCLAEKFELVLFQSSSDID